MESEIRFCTSPQDKMNMLTYYKGFDPIGKKYDLKKIAEGLLNKAGVSGLSDYGIDFEPTMFQKLNDEQQRKLLGQWLNGKLSRIESTHELASLTKKDASHIVANLYLIYNTDSSDIDRQVELMNLVSQKVISQYLQIDGLERLFNELYVDFEWEMHLGMDHNRQRMQLYRDHFVHQVRDAYMMDRLLEDGGMYQRVYEVLNEPSNSKVSTYFSKMVEKQKQHIYQAEYQMIIDFDDGFIPRNIVYMAAYMAGLFHDIGYPETYLRTLHRRICDYMPSMHRQPNMELPSGLFSMLRNSLLFRVVPYEEIRQRVNSEKIDHGTLSALGFLLHFYENGAILGLEPYKAAAVELAALAIYNHTYKYGITGEKQANDYRPRFSTNPISYLLRICDDLQEWDRVYFEISHRSNILTCSACHTPVIGQKITEIRNGGGTGLLPSRQQSMQEKCECRRYICNCGNKGGDGNYGDSLFKRTFDGFSSFPYRRLYNVKVCDSVEVCSLTLDEKNETVMLDKANNILVKLDYDAYRLLNIAFISPTYAKYRIEELNKLKPLLMAQRHLPRIWLDFFVTANPILIKVRLIQRYFEDSNRMKQRARIKTYVNSVLEDYSIAPSGKVESHLFSDIVQELMKAFDVQLHEYYKDSQTDICTYVKRAVRMYVKLYLYYEIYRNIDHHNLKLRTYMQPVVGSIADQVDSDPVFRCLLGDALLQLSRCYAPEILSGLRGVPQDYCEQFSPGDWEQALTGSENASSAEFYDTAVERYTDQQQYEPLRQRNNVGDRELIIDAFTDLGFFQYIHDNSFINGSNVTDGETPIS